MKIEKEIEELLNKIEKVIFSTLVVENKQSYKYCKEKMERLIKQFANI